MSNFTIGTWQTHILANGQNWNLELDWRVTSINRETARAKIQLATYVRNKTSASRKVDAWMDIDGISTYGNFMEIFGIRQFQNKTVGAGTRATLLSSSEYELNIHTDGHPSKIAIYPFSGGIADSDTGNNLITEVIGSAFSSGWDLDSAHGYNNSFIYTRDEGYGNCLTIDFPVFPKKVILNRVDSEAILTGTTRTAPVIGYSQENVNPAYWTSGEFKLNVNVPGLGWFTALPRRTTSPYNDYMNAPIPYGEVKNYLAPGETKTITYRLYTYTNDTAVDVEMGYSEVSYQLTHTADTHPVISAKTQEILKDVTTRYEVSGNYQNVCRLKLNATATTDGISGVQLFEFDFGADGIETVYTTSTTASCTKLLTQSQTFTPKVRAKASDGRFGAWVSYNSVVVSPYAKTEIPTFTGVRSDDGASIDLDIFYTSTVGTSGNATAILSETVSGNTEIKNVVLPSANSIGSVSIPNLQAEKEYSYTLEVTDPFYIVSKTISIKSNFVLVDFDRGYVTETGEVIGGVGIGKLHDKGILDVQGDVYTDGKINGVARIEPFYQTVRTAISSEDGVTIGISADGFNGSTEIPSGQTPRRTLDVLGNVCIGELIEGRTRNIRFYQRSGTADSVFHYMFSSPDYAEYALCSKSDTDGNYSGALRSYKSYDLELAHSDSSFHILRAPRLHLRLGSHESNGTARIYFGTSTDSSYVSRGTDATIDVMGGLYSDGNISGASITNRSSERYKMNVQELSHDLSDKILNVTPRIYWVTENIELAVEEIEQGEASKPVEFTNNSLRGEHGLIAEELLSLGLDEYVHINARTGLVEGIHYDKLTVPILQLCKRQQEEIAELQLKQIQTEIKLQKLEERIGE